MIAAIILAAAASASAPRMPSFEPEVFIGPDGCRYIRKRQPPKRAIAARPPASAASAPAKPASAPKAKPRPKVKKQTAKEVAPVPDGFVRDCDALPPAASMILPGPPFSPVPDDVQPPFPSEVGPPLSEAPDLPVPLLPPPPLVAVPEEPAYPPAGPGWFPPLIIQVPPVFVIGPPVVIPPPVPEPEVWTVMLAGFGAMLVLLRNRRAR